MACFDHSDRPEDPSPPRKSSDILARGTEGSNPCTLQSGYWLVGIVDWPDRAGLPGVARESCVLSTSRGPAPRQVGRDGSPVGGCASSASTGIDARRGGPDVSDAREVLNMAEEVEWFVGIDWASQSHQVCLVDAHGECLGGRAVAHGGAGIEELCDWLIARTGATPEVNGVAIE